MIREMTQQDSQRVLEIYKMGIDTRNATFETSVPTWEEWDMKHLQHSRFVYVENDKVKGWVAFSPTSTRFAYRGVAEISIYIDTRFTAHGIGSKLMEVGILSSEENGIWTISSGVFPENTGSMKLHQKFGFRMIGQKEKIAQLDGVWRDTVLFERRSKKEEYL